MLVSCKFIPWLKMGRFRSGYVLLSQCHGDLVNMAVFVYKVCLFQVYANGHASSETENTAALINRRLPRELTLRYVEPIHC